MLFTTFSALSSLPKTYSSPPAAHRLRPSSFLPSFSLLHAPVAKTCKNNSCRSYLIYSSSSSSSSSSSISISVKSLGLFVFLLVERRILMGGVAVLHPQDLFNRDNLLSPAMKTHSLGRNPPSVSRSSHRRKRSPQKNTGNHLEPAGNNKPAMMMGQVKILKRGETLPIGTPLSSSENLKVEEKKKKQKQQQVPKTNTGKKKIGALAAGFSQKQIRISDCYAGSACISSPPPSSLPVPAFFKKKSIVLTDDNDNSNEEATSDLLKLLRLDLS